MRIGQYAPRYHPNQTSAFSMFRSIGNVSAAQNKPWPNKPRVAEDISDVQQAVAMAPPPSIGGVEELPTPKPSPEPPPLFDLLKDYKSDVDQAYGNYQNTFGQPLQDSMLSRGNWGNSAATFMPTQYTPALKALEPVASTPIDMKQLAALLSPETTQEGSIPYRDPILAQHAQKFSERANIARKKADEFRANWPRIRRIIPILNNALNRDEASYRDIAARYDSEAVNAETNAIKAGLLSRQQQRAEAAAALAAQVGITKQYTDALTAGFGTGAQAANIANDRARIDLARAASIANTPPMSILNIDHVLKNAPNIMGMERGLYEASPERRKQVVEQELARIALSNRMTEGQIAATDMSVLNSGTEFATQQERNESLVNQALSHLQRYQAPDLRGWVESETLTRKRAYEDDQTPAGRAMLNDSLLDVAGAAFVAQFESDKNANAAYVNNYFDNVFGALKQSTPDITPRQLELYTSKALGNYLSQSQQLPERIRSDPRQLQFTIQQLSKRIVQKYLQDQKRMMQAE